MLTYIFTREDHSSQETERKEEPEDCSKFENPATLLHSIFSRYVLG